MAAKELFNNPHISSTNSHSRDLSSASLFMNSFEGDVLFNKSHDEG